MCALQQYLSYPVGSIHSLQIPHRVPVMLHKHHSVCSRQVEAKTTDVGGQQQHVNGGIIVESKIWKKWNKKQLINVHIEWQRSPSDGQCDPEPAHLDTMEWRRPACTLPSSRR